MKFLVFLKNSPGRVFGLRNLKFCLQHFLDIISQCTKRLFNRNEKNKIKIHFLKNRLGSQNRFFKFNSNHVEKCAKRGGTKET